ncbi:MAG: hypothetical protein JNJ99_10765 [Crocinitomicaceae bacterium]|nr:hypothetical protein [Crocinitomicaceae bacterium]
MSTIFFKVLFTWIRVKESFYRFRNKNKKKILIYTDSRGHEITRLKNKHNPFSSYANYFIKNYNTTTQICPEKHTTLYDFLYFMKYNKSHYDYVISHTGVVCFAPRPYTQGQDVVKLKKEKIVDLFGEEIYNQILQFEGYPEKYLGEKTTAIVPEFMVDLISQELNKIPNLIWIACNPVVDGWLGNYNKPRPENLGIVSEKSKKVIQNLKNVKVVDITNWTESEIKKYTCDNVHLTIDGMRFLEQKITEFFTSF